MHAIFSIVYELFKQIKPWEVKDLSNILVQSDQMY